MADTPETIYLIPGEDVDGARCMVWCDDPAPSDACDPAEAVKYVRADKHQEIIDRQANAAKMGMDAAKKSAQIMERNAKQMRAESSPEVVESERAANAMLTDRVEQLEAMLQDARQELVRAQNGEPMSQRYGDCECGDLSAAGQHVCDNCMAGFKAGIVPSGHIMISAEEYDFLRQQASKGAA